MGSEMCIRDRCSEDMLEYELTNNIIALPIDQRYGREEMDYIIKLLA